MEKVLYLVIGSSGEYSDRIEWPVALYESEEMARKAAAGAKRFARDHEMKIRMWHRDVREHWEATHPMPQFRNAARPVQPEFKNPFDQAHGYGDEYRVEPVPVLTDLPEEA